MKTYFLDDIASHQDVPEALSQVLPGQQKPWLLLDLRGDVIAYFNAQPNEAEPNKIEVTSDVNGRHYSADKVRRRYPPRTANYIGWSHPR
jgi:hypothetical protein